ncbi:hypothetical protein [Schaalia vaccimaxillae]|uniref:hypothetical protein n=1 Tax=Schaalia vaccimaxillae TaxID=183916 RepID=UPI0003B5EE06|nr:hypothetical protein [Schaalia vaccimaxillae]
MSKTNLIGTYVDALPGIPGSSSKVFGIEAEVQALKEALSEEETRIQDLPRVAQSLDGAVADSFSQQHETMRKAWIELVDGVDAGAQAINRYGWTLEDLERRASQLEDQMLAYDARLTGLPVGERIEQLLDCSNEVTAIRAAYLELIEKAKEASHDCARELGKALDPDDVIEERQAMSMANRTVALTSSDFERINTELVAPDYTSVRQGGIGDCHLVSVVQALMASKVGRRHIRSIMRPHFDARGAQDGYTVTLRDTSSRSESSFEYDILVTEVYANGVQGNGIGGANVAGVLEAAVGQYHSSGEAASTGNYAGYVCAVSDLLVGRSQVVYAGDEDSAGEAVYGVDARQAIIEAVRSGQCVTASMGQFGFGGSQSNGGVGIAHVRIDGKPVAVEIESMHSYAILDATASALTLHNPWGENCPVAGNTVLGGTFSIGWDEFGRNAAMAVLADCRL